MYPIKVTDLSRSKESSFEFTEYVGPLINGASLGSSPFSFVHAEGYLAH